MSDGARRFVGYLSDLSAGRQPTRRAPTPAQLRLIECLAHGMTVEMAAETCGVTTETAKTQMKYARERMAAKSAPHAVALCFRNGWLR